MKFLNILIKEGRKEDLKKKYSDKYDEEDLDFILGISDLQDFNHKYTDWVLKHILEYADVDIMAETAVDLVKDFDKYQKNLQKKDINQYLSFEELEKALEPYKEKEKEKELESQTEKIFEDENFLVLVPKTQEASCKYGSGTKWCVTQPSGGHFERYTRGKQGLYFIIRKKGKQTEPHYKVAVHINDIGDEGWWDARDQRMNSEAVTLFKDYFSEIYSKIIENYKEKRKPNQKEIDKVFEKQDQIVEVGENFKGSGKTLRSVLNGFERIPDMPGKAMGSLKIYLDNDLIDAYDVYVSYGVSDNGKLNVSVGFDVFGEFDDMDFEPKFDFKFWEGWGLDGDLETSLTTNEIRNRLFNFILRNIHKEIAYNTKFEAYVKDIAGPVWRPDRFNYGYTFKRGDKGLVKKLVDWLDSGKIGTKVDFLVDLGVFQKVKEDGKIKYKRPGTDYFYSQRDLRGQYSSFFASAKHAGILDYRKVGKDYLFIKGPNFEAFKQGKLRAL
jgi:hypothetical protein